MKNATPQIILASVSIGRKQLLEKLGVDFEILPSTIDEDAIIHSNPIKMLQMRSLAKVENVVKAISHQPSTISSLSSCHPEFISGSSFKNEILKRVQDDDILKAEGRKLKAERYLIIAADSMAILNNKTYGKTPTKVLGKKMLLELMGKTHEFVTSVSIVYLNKSLKEFKILKQWKSISTTRVTMRKLNPQELDEYVARFDFTRFAAGYTLNELPWDLITKIDGSYTNVIGLPFEVILPIFRELEIL